MLRITNRYVDNYGNQAPFSETTMELYRRNGMAVTPTYIYTGISG